MTDVPSCPRCGTDGGADFCPNDDGSITYRCYHCTHIWLLESDDEFYMGDDARLDACRGLHKPRRDTDDA